MHVNKNPAVVQVTSARELLATIEKGQQRRHVSSTQMNRESSRSHLIMSVIIEATNLQTQNVTKGKLSFVDLAGSERCVIPWQSSMSHESLISLQLATCRPHVPRKAEKVGPLASRSAFGKPWNTLHGNLKPGALL